MRISYFGARYYYVANIQGDVIALTDSTGTTVVEYTYDAWGNILTTTGTLADTLGQANPIRYRGYVYDEDTGFYYLQSRYYDPKIGRFINADAFISTGQGLLGNNMFSYCGNNPIIYRDETGTTRSVSMICIIDPESLEETAKCYAEQYTTIKRRVIRKDGKIFVTYDVSVSSELFSKWENDEDKLSTVVEFYSSYVFAEILQRVKADEYDTFWLMSKNHIYSELMAHVVIWFMLAVPNTRIADLNVDEDRMAALVPMEFFGYDGRPCYVFKNS